MVDVAASTVRDVLERDGYVIVEDVFDPAADFSPLYDEWQSILDEVVEGLVSLGVSSSRFESLPFEQRLLAVTAESGRNIAGFFDISLPQSNIQRDTPVCASPALFALLTHPRLLDVVEDVIGPEVTSNPTQHVRMKLPERSSADRRNGLTAGVPYHQDQGVLLPEADESEILTCWVAVTDADESNGCLRVYPGTEHGGLVGHCSPDSPAMQGPGQIGIPGRLLPPASPTPLPMRAGSALFFNRTLIHGSGENLSTDRVRISLDLRYQPTGQPTGRPAFPSFVARSRSDPGSILSDPAAWRDMWYAARARLAEDGTPRFNRWDSDSAVCA
jgi:ectoine hydroxylase-related dioxygenase (phytanoyl-CoA dioxygenase family)